MAALCTRRLRDGGMNIKLVWGLLGYPLYLFLMLIASNFNVGINFDFFAIAASILFFISIVCTMIIAVLALAPSKQPS